MRWLGRFLYGALRGLDALRRVLHLAFLLALLAIALAAVGQLLPPRVPERAALVVRPSGEIVEQLSGEPAQRLFSETEGEAAPETLLWDLTTAIRAAGSDRRIAALVIDTDDLSGAGQVKLEELAAAIRDFRRSGKRVISYGQYFLQSPYYLAAQADEVYLDPFGFVLLDGYDRYRMYFKKALQKLNVDMHLFRVGNYKSAEEIFTRDNMSNDDRAQSEAYLSALWQGYQRAVAGARQLKADDIAAYADNYATDVAAAGGDTAQVAKDGHLVSDLKSEQQVDDRLLGLVGADPSGKSYRQITVQDYLHATHAEEKQRGRGAAVGVVIASGDILDGKQPPGTIGGVSTSQLLHTALLDSDIKAVVLRIDSPGGSVLASEQIYRAVQALQQNGKPVVVSMSDVAASGGYYIASGADEIIASPNTITGSIGVFAAFPTFSRTLAKVGIAVDGVGTTPLSGAMELDRPLSAAVGQLLQSGVDHTYEEFLERVAKGRGKPIDYINQIAQGHVWAGVDALRIGLVDRLGTYEDAVRDAAARAGLRAPYGVRRVEPELTLMQQLLLQVGSGVQDLLARLGVLHQSATATGVAQWTQRLQHMLAHWAHLSSANSIYAYCFCGVE
jgi:protease IV